MKAILVESIVQLDNAIEGEKKIERCGSTVLIVLRAKETVWVTCSGDSGALACTRNDQDEIVKGVILHEQHTVENERQRLQWIAAMRPDLSRRMFQSSDIRTTERNYEISREAGGRVRTTSDLVSCIGTIT